MSSARASSRNAPREALRATAGVFLCLFAVLLWTVRSVCGLPIGAMADVATVVAGSGTHTVPEAPGTEHTADVETEETEVEGEMAESSTDGDGDGDDGAEEAYSPMPVVALGPPPAEKLRPDERAPSTSACTRRHPRPGEPV